jgi:uncharacterized membrane protein
MRSRSKIIRAFLWSLLLVALLGACSRNTVGFLPAFGPESSDSKSPLRDTAIFIMTLLEGAGIGVILLGAIVATVNFLYRIAQESFSIGRYHRYRENLGEVILLGLEFLVAADIVGTVALSLRIENVLSLAAIILVRTFLSFTLEVETTGYWPWQRGGQSRTGVREAMEQGGRHRSRKQEEENVEER